MIRLPAVLRAATGVVAATLALAAALPATAQREGAQREAGQSDGAPDVETSTAAEAAPLTKGEQRLAKLLEGRVAGKPVRCIRTTRDQPMETIDRTAYVFGWGNTIYIQPTRDPKLINGSDTLVIRRFSASELCRLDVITTVDSSQGLFTGAVFFVDFVPYTRVKDNPSSQG